MTSALLQFAKVLSKHGWNVSIRQSANVQLPAVLSKRYNTLPSQYREFLETVERCIDPNEVVWFLSIDDFEGKAATAFAWNDFELQSLDGARKDPDWQREIETFWDKHLPIAISVKAGYSFLALRLEGLPYGCVVVGREPEYEDVRVVSESFSELIGMLSDAVEKNFQLPDFSDFI
jgi:hypothetical protein